MFKSLNIPWSTGYIIIKKWKEYGDCAKRALVREATKTPIGTLKELQASVAKIGETVHIATVAQTLQQPKLYGRVAEKKTQLKKL